MQKAPSAPRPQPNNAHTMPLFIPRTQLQNMLNQEVNDAMRGHGDLTKLMAITAAMHQRQNQPLQPIFSSYDFGDDYDDWD